MIATQHGWAPEVFETAARTAGFDLDPSQRDAAARLLQLGSEISGRRISFVRNTPRGVYVWGPVGRGKSWLVDTFYDAVPATRKRRLHFHEFFREFYTRYAAHRSEKRACDRAVRELLGDYRLVCFDEFHVHDPGDATIMAKVMDSLFAQRITLVATSNYPPAGLLPNPLFHHLIEPLATTLENTLDIVEVAGPHDYRQTRRPGTPAAEFERGGFLWPGTGAQLAEAGLVAPTPAERRSVPLGDRAVTARAVRGDAVWFDFADLCDGPYSTIDYLRLADRFRHWTLSGLPPLSTTDREAAQRFANLVDVLCDRDRRLHLVAAAPLAECLTGDRLPPDIHRTASRLALLPGAAAPVPAGDQ
ncbi:cell division protein ZapE [Nocardia jinanensis]|uniref:Cell division protein ZapE n=1 Tax=Nocardia jinanensis TaxID=382504 RepID=A0A917RQB2_9NOCA|nr:cell division protein ZapE [Nocardia jinanensis]GGL19799.1 cell division protein ZapE [Nocardia jinanensis]